MHALGSTPRVLSKHPRSDGPWWMDGIVVLLHQLLQLAPSVSYYRQVCLSIKFILDQRNLQSHRISITQS